ncbi:MAG: NERD domain-containing protein, partial [Betaproteobacteria bacterium]
MAKVIPDGWRELSATGAAAGELQTLGELAEGLPDTYTIYHGVHWTRIEKNNFAIYGEIDYAIVGPTGKLLLIEKKAGILTETADGLMKSYTAKEKSVPFQMARNADALHSRLRQLCGADKTFVDSLLYCPHYKVKNPGSAGIDPSRIIDAGKADRLIPIIQSILPEEGEVLAAKPKVHRFLGDLLEIVPDVHAVVGEAGSLYTRLSGGLSEWARKIECEPFRLRVTGTAGSGKTQLAMAVYRDALKAGRRPLYVCYNRPLADHIATIVPDGGQVTNYHQLGTRICNNVKRPADFSKPDAFAHIEKELDQYQPAAAELFDELIVDEGQDFR